MEDIESQDLAEWLDSRFLGSYATMLAQNGYTSVLDISGCSDDEIVSIVRLFKKPGHRLKARLLLEDLRAAAKGFKPASLSNHLHVISQQSQTAHNSNGNFVAAPGAAASDVLNASAKGRMLSSNRDADDDEEGKNDDVQEMKNESAHNSEDDEDTQEVVNAALASSPPDRISAAVARAGRESTATNSEYEAPPADTEHHGKFYDDHDAQGGGIVVERDLDDDELLIPVGGAGIGRKSIAPVIEPESDPEDDGEEDKWEEKDLIVVAAPSNRGRSMINKAKAAVVDDESNEPEVIANQEEEYVQEEEPELGGGAAAENVQVIDDEDPDTDEIVVVPPKKPAGGAAAGGGETLDKTEEIIVLPKRDTTAPKPKMNPIAEVMLAETQAKPQLASGGQAAPVPAAKPSVGANGPPVVPAKPGVGAAGGGNRVKEMQEKLKQDALNQANPRPTNPGPKPVVGKLNVNPNVVMPLPKMMGKMPSVTDVRQASMPATGNHEPSEEPISEVDDAPKPVDQEKLKKVIAGGFQPGMPPMMMHHPPKASMQVSNDGSDDKTEEELLPCDDEDQSALRKIDVKNIKTIVKDGSVEFQWTKNGNPVGGKRNVYILLDETTVYWFKAKTDANPAGKISLARQNLLIDNPEETDFITITAGVDVFTITLRSDVEQVEWAKAMKKTKIMMRSAPIANPTTGGAAAASSSSSGGGGGASSNAPAKAMKSQPSAKPANMSLQDLVPAGGDDEDDDGPSEPPAGVAGGESEADFAVGVGSGAAGGGGGGGSGMNERDVEKLLMEGQVFMKYKHGRAKKRHIWAPPEMDKLYWGGSDDKSKAKGYILIKDIADVVEGCKGAKKQNLAFTITTADRSLELEAPTPQVKTRWMEAARALLNNKPKKAKK